MLSEQQLRDVLGNLITQKKGSIEENDIKKWSEEFTRFCTIVKYDRGDYAVIQQDIIQKIVSEASPSRPEQTERPDSPIEDFIPDNIDLDEEALALLAQLEESDDALLTGQASCSGSNTEHLLPEKTIGKKKIVQRKNKEKRTVRPRNRQVASTDIQFVLEYAQVREQTQIQSTPGNVYIHSPAIPPERQNERRFVNNFLPVQRTSLVAPSQVTFSIEQLWEQKRSTGAWSEAALENKFGAWFGELSLRKKLALWAFCNETDKEIFIFVRGNKYKLLESVQKSQDPRGIPALLLYAYFGYFEFSGQESYTIFKAFSKENNNKSKDSAKPAEHIAAFLFGPEQGKMATTLFGDSRILSFKEKAVVFAALIRKNIGHLEGNSFLQTVNSVIDDFIENKKISSRR